MADFSDPQAWRIDTGTGKPPQLPPKYGFHKGHKSPGMSHSQSEGKIDFRYHERNDHNLRVGKIFESTAGGYYSRPSKNTDASSAFPRGRTITRTPSPVKALEDIKEDQGSNSPSRPIKRSRSPFKQMFGENGWLGRSTSMNELPDERYRKTGIKHWGEKLKQRVENLVGLQLIPITSLADDDRPKTCRRFLSSYRRLFTSTNRPPSFRSKANSTSPLVLPCRRNSTRKWSS